MAPAEKLPLAAGYVVLAASVSAVRAGDIKYKVRPISCKVFTLVIETGGWTALRTLVMG